MNKDWLAINTIRFLGIDAINKANSGHPGIVIGAAPMAHVLFSKHLNIHSKDSHWFNRDRFILSAGHGSMLLYAINHLSGYKISIEDIKKFRNLGNTPGHPEYGHTDGVETTSGPLGQGISNAVGMAIAEAHLSARFNKADITLIDHYTYVLCGDGDLQEGVALEASSLAGHLGLGKLIVLYDSNDIQLDGPTHLAYSDAVKKKFEAMHWHHILVKDGDDLEAIDKAIKKAKKQTDKPTLIEVKTIIGKGTTKQGTSSVHGSPIGEVEAVSLKEKFRWTYQPFEVPQESYDLYKETVIKRGRKKYNQWHKLLKTYEKSYPQDAKLLSDFLSGKIDTSVLDGFTFAEGSKDATRNVSGKVLDALSKANLNLIGGSADLTSSTKAKGADGHFSKEHYLARNINFGVREHAMGAVINGITLHGGLKAFSGAFFVFSDYMKPPLRLAAIMDIPSIFVFSHDTVAVGEDGPTHQPIEQLISLRSVPNLQVIRPADGNETVAAWKFAVTSKHPTSIILTRQNVGNLEKTSYEGLCHGAYIVDEEEKQLDGILLAAGSEVSLAVETKKVLKAQGYDIRVVSMPSHDLFMKQDKAYKQQILPKGVKILALEMGSSYSWYPFTQHIYGIDTYGVSAPLDTVLEYFGFTKEKVAERFKQI